MEDASAISGHGSGPHSGPQALLGHATCARLGCGEGPLAEMGAEDCGGLCREWTPPHPPMLMIAERGSGLERGIAHVP